MIVVTIFTYVILMIFKSSSDVFVMFAAVDTFVSRPRLRFFWFGGSDSEVFRIFELVYDEFWDINFGICENPSCKDWPWCFYFKIMKNLSVFLLFIFQLNVFTYSDEIYLKKRVSWPFFFNIFEIWNEIEKVLSHCKNMNYSINNCNFMFFEFYQQIFFILSIIVVICLRISRKNR